MDFETKEINIKETEVTLEGSWGQSKLEYFYQGKDCKILYC